MGEGEVFCSPTCSAAADAVDWANFEDRGRYEASLSPDDKARFEEAFAEAKMVNDELNRLSVEFRVRRLTQHCNCIWRFQNTLPLTSIDGMKAWSARGYAFHSNMLADLKKLDAAKAA